MTDAASASIDRDASDALALVVPLADHRFLESIEQLLATHAMLTHEIVTT